MALEVYRNFSLENYHTFGAKVRARAFVRVSTYEELLEAIHLEVQPKMVLGGGSNLLFTRDFDGLIIQNTFDGIKVLHTDKNSAVIEVGGGVSWHQLVIWCLDQDLGGLENLSLIPGTVGAAPIQNIGAYGVELADVFESLDAIDLTTGESRTFQSKDCKFGYRQSIFKSERRGLDLVSKVRLRLTKNNHTLNISYGGVQNALEAKGITHPGIKDISDTIIEIRQSKLPDPAKIGNAGSFFKNPVISTSFFNRISTVHSEIPHYNMADSMIKIPAAWLIENCGWKGKRIGDAGTYDRHALVLVNHGSATGTELWELANQIMSDVMNTFEIQLEPEVNIID